MLVLFQCLTGMPILKKRMNQVVTEGFIKRLDSHCTFTDRGDFSIGLLFDQKLNGFMYQLLILGVIISGNRNNPWFIFRFWKKVALIEGQSLVTQGKGLLVLQRLA